MYGPAPEHLCLAEDWQIALGRTGVSCWPVDEVAPAMCMFVDLCLPVGVIFLVELRAESDVVLSFARNDSFFKNCTFFKCCMWCVIKGFLSLWEGTCYSWPFVIVWESKYKGYTVIPGSKLPGITWGSSYLANSEKVCFATVTCLRKFWLYFLIPLLSSRSIWADSIFPAGLSM